MNIFPVPAAASNVTADGNGTSLLLSWQQPEGDLDALAVTLLTNGTSQWETTLPPDATEVAVDQLTPGSAYQVVMTSKSGNLTNKSETTIRTGEDSSFLCWSISFLSFTIFVLCSAPAAAALLSLSPSSLGGLLLLWSPPAGHWESYSVLLFDGSQQLVSTTLNPETVNFSFPGTRLTPGRLYRAVLRVESGGLMAESSCEGATGQITK